MAKPLDFLMLLSLSLSKSRLSHSQRVIETCNVVLTFESGDEILWCDHSNETSFAVHLHGTRFVFQYFTKIVNEIWRFS